MALATKSQSQKIFEKLKTKPANKVRIAHAISITLLKESAIWRRILTWLRSALTAVRKTLPGPRSRSESTYVSTARPTIAISVSTSPLCAQQTSTSGNGTSFV